MEKKALAVMCAVKPAVMKQRAELECQLAFYFAHVREEESAEAMKYCALCCFAKDEDFYIEEWVNYHLLLGFDTILLYDNQSRRPLREFFPDLIAEGRVVVHETVGALGTKAQGMAYTHCFETYGKEFVWIAVLDADELLLLHTTLHVKAFLASYENYGGVFLNWVHYGNPKDYGHEFQSMIATSLYREETVCTVGKSIVRPPRVAAFTGPHGPKYREPYYAVNTEHFPLEPSVYSAPPCLETAQVNHYSLRSRKDYARKVAKWEMAGIHITVSFDEKARNFTKKDLSALVFFDKLRSQVREPLAVTFPTVTALAEYFLDAFEKESNLDSLELLLCDCVCSFPDEPLLWLFRSMLARKQNAPHRALLAIREAFRFSGNSLLFFELAAVYRMLGENQKALSATVQARYKRHVEETTCAPPCDPSLLRLAEDSD